MWIGAIRLIVATQDSEDAGTDSLVQVTVLRDGAQLRVLNLDHPTENDLERGAIRNYDYLELPRRNDRTPELPPGIGRSPMPFPTHGFEYSDGLRGHLDLRLEIRGDDMWVMDSIALHVRLIRLNSSAWVEDPDFTPVARWSVPGRPPGKGGRIGRKGSPPGVAMSTDTDEGFTPVTLHLRRGGKML